MKSCQNITSHIRRLEGQLGALSRRIESDADCAELVHLFMSTSKSFDSLKAKIIESYLRENVVEKSSTKLDKDIDSLMKLIKS